MAASAVVTLALPLVFGAAPPGPALVGVGLTYPYADDVALLGASWQYNWSRLPLNTPAEDVPMLWGKNDVGRPIGGDSTWLLTFNEPDIYGQAMITPTDAIRLWRTVEETYLDTLLVSPATWIWDDWLDDFYDGYVATYGRPPRLDAMACHAYGDADYILRSVDRCLQWAHDHGLDQVWLTEFAVPPCRVGDVERSVQLGHQVLAGLKNRPRVTRYAWFATRIKGDEGWALGSGCDAPLFDATTGALTPWGEMYAAR